MLLLPSYEYRLLDLCRVRQITSAVSFVRSKLTATLYFCVMASYLIRITIELIVTLCHVVLLYGLGYTAGSRLPKSTRPYGKAHHVANPAPGGDWHWTDRIFGNESGVVSVRIVFCASLVEIFRNWKTHQAAGKFLSSVKEVQLLHT